MKVGIYTLGCKVNTYESEYVELLFRNSGYEIENFSETCDIYVINTCTVTNNSDAKSRKIINQAIRKNKDACIVAMGCFIEANKDYNIPLLSVMIGNKDKSKIVDLVEEWFKERKAIQATERLSNEFENMYISSFGTRTRAFVKIQDGCENFCSYCIIPYVRGKCCSKNENRVINEVNDLVNNGYREIVLTGIHTGHYGVDLNTTFNDLLLKLVKIKGLSRLRISSIEITELNTEILDTINKYNVIVDHLHIPLQSGSDKILKLMNRKYDTAYFMNKINEIRKIRPNISITTDVIVGFPGESDELFEETVEFIKKVNFSKLHVFPYSKRKGTVAANLSNQIPDNVKKERVDILLSLSQKLEIKYMNLFLNKEVSVLIEKSGSASFGHTGNYLAIEFPKYIEKNKIVKGIITNIYYPKCHAELTTD